MLPDDPACSYLPAHSGLPVSQMLLVDVVKQSHSLKGGQWSMGACFKSSENWLKHQIVAHCKTFLAISTLIPYASSFMMLFIPICSFGTISPCDFHRIPLYYGGICVNFPNFIAKEKGGRLLEESCLCFVLPP